jgi:hypothetical protein
MHTVGTKAESTSYIHLKHVWKNVVDIMHLGNHVDYDKTSDIIKRFHVRKQF